MWQAFLSGVLALFSGAFETSVRLRTQPRFSLLEEGGGLGIESHNSFSFSSYGQGSKPRWFAEAQNEESNWCGRQSAGKCEPTIIRSHRYIDGNECPALAREMDNLTLVRTRERNASHPIVSDTPLLSLVSYGGEGMRSERLAEYVGPLATWWRNSQARLAPCWRTTRPADL